MQHLIFSSLLVFAPVIFAAANNQIKSNVWDFLIDRKIFASFEFDGIGMAMWEDQSVEHSSGTSNRQFYVTPETEFLPNSTKCEYNDLTGAHFVSYEIQLWSERLQTAAINRLKQMEIVVTPDQVQPLPFYQVSTDFVYPDSTVDSTWIPYQKPTSIVIDI